MSSARQTDDGACVPDPAVLERMLSAAGLPARRSINGVNGEAASIGGGGGGGGADNDKNSSSNIHGFAAALESLARDELERIASEAISKASAPPPAAAAPRAGLLPVPPRPLKRCRVCKTHQPIDSFYRVSTSRDGRDARCRTCDARQCAERRRRRREQQQQREEAEAAAGGGATTTLAAATQKFCRKCQQLKAGASFYRNRANADGLCDLCKQCFREAADERKEARIGSGGTATTEAAAASETKPCRRCGEHLPPGDFHRNASNRDGLSTSCKRCHSRSTRERAELKGRLRPPPPEAKRCGRCGASKAPDGFYRSATSADGMQSLCKPCYSLAAAERRARTRALARHQDQGGGAGAQ